MSDIKVHDTITVPIHLLDESDENPNEMTDDQFSALVEEIAENGFMVPIQVIGPDENGRYKMFGGHHRKRAAEVLGMPEVSAVVRSPEEFDEDWRKIQLVKQNILHGNLNPEKFTQLYNEMAGRYEMEALQTLMGFTHADAFRKVYLDARNALPPEMAERLDDVRDELKSIDDLSLVLNRLFTEYGSDVEFHFMFFSYGGKEHIMIQLQHLDAWRRLKDFADWCRANQSLMDEELMARMDWPV